MKLFFFRRKLPAIAAFTLTSAFVVLCFYRYNDTRRDQLFDKHGERLNFNEEKEVSSASDKFDAAWFFKNRNVRSLLLKTGKLWPFESAGDRIIEQLMLSPNNDQSIKFIHYRNVRRFDYKSEAIFNECPVKNCMITDSFQKADIVIFKDSVGDVRPASTQNQVWILFCLENPKAGCSSTIPSAVNWTATYRRDSDIVAPYAKWVYYNESVQNVPQERDYFKGKTKEIAWFVSNCNAWNGRISYAQELAKHINVDIYGKCGNKICSRSTNNRCLEMLRNDYKFYLAFENNNCRDYITEKFFSTALENDVIPIAMGAHPDDYLAVAPYKSFIHVDDFPSPKDLADYLKVLGQDAHMYNSYFKWKNTGEFINTHFLCRVCAMAHSNYTHKYYENVNAWFENKDTCRQDSWLL